MAVDAEFAAISQGTYVGTTAVVLLMGKARMWLAHCGEWHVVGTPRANAGLQRGCSSPSPISTPPCGACAHASSTRQCPTASCRVLTTGDSRAVIGRRGQAAALTSDHKANREDEVVRVQVRRTSWPPVMSGSQGLLSPCYHGLGWMPQHARVHSQRDACTLAMEGACHHQQSPATTHVHHCLAAGCGGARVVGPGDGRAGGQPRHRRPLPAPLRHQRARGEQAPACTSQHTSCCRLCPAVAACMACRCCWRSMLSFARQHGHAAMALVAPRALPVLMAQHASTCPGRSILLTARLRTRCW